MAGILKKIGDTASSLYGQGSALAAQDPTVGPGLEAVKANRDEYNTAMASAQEEAQPVVVVAAPAKGDLVGNGRYGDKPGEQRIDTSSMTRPLGSALAGSRAEGGPVDADKAYVVGENGPEVVVPKEDGEVVPSEGAPVDFGGPVFENPDNVKPKLDTEPAGEAAKPEGVSVDISNPSAAQLIPGEKEKQNGEGVKPTLSSVETPAPATATGTPRPKAFGPQPVGEPSAEAKSSQFNEAAAAPDPNQIIANQQADQAKDVAKQRGVIAQDKKAAAAKGDLVGLGTAIIHEKELNKTEPMNAVMEAAATPVTPTYGGSLSALGKVNPEAAHTQLEQERDTLKQQELSPDLVASGTARRQLAELNAQNPYGTAANHPGVLGKIEHGLAKAGNIAGEALVPNLIGEIPGTEANRIQQRHLGEEEEKQGESERVSEADVAEKRALAKNAGVGKTNNERVFQDLMRGDNGGPRVNPDTGNPYTEQEALLASQGTGKTPEEEYVQAQLKEINPDTGKLFTRPEATKDFEMMKTGAKPLHGMEKRVADYNAARNLPDSPANREAAQTAIQKSDTDAKAWAALPAAEAKMRQQANLTEEEQQLNNIHADSSQRGLKADELQNTEDSRHTLVAKAIDTAKSAANDSDASQLAASITPVLATMANIRAEGLNRINTAEMSRFMPANGSLGRWAAAHVDQFLAGEIPPQYKAEVMAGLNNLSRFEDIQHEANTRSVNDTVRHGGVNPVVNPKTGSANKTEPSKAATSTPAAGHKIGDPIVQNGKTYTVTSVDKDGKVTGAK